MSACLCTHELLSCIPPGADTGRGKGKWECLLDEEALRSLRGQEGEADFLFDCVSVSSLGALVLGAAGCSCYNWRCLSFR